MKSKTVSLIAVSLGILLMILSAVMLTVRQIQKAKADVDIAAVVARMEKAMPGRSAGIIEKRSDIGMPSIEIDGTDFIGLLELPGRNTVLPVGAKWDAAGLGFRPARYLGSIYDGTLIIGGRYESGGFDFADKFEIGEEITFTDMTGRLFRYTVNRIRHSDNAKTETLKSGDYDLTLFVKKDSRFLIIGCKAA